MQDNFSYFHAFLYRCFKEKAQSNFIPFHSVREVMRRRLFRVPNNLYCSLLKEMEGKTIKIPPLIKRCGSLNGKNIYYELVGGNEDKKLNTDLSLF